MDITEQKRNLRLEIKTRLRSLQYSYKEASLAVYDNLCKVINLESSKVVATYIDFQNELPTLPFLPNLFHKQINDEVSHRTIAIPFCEGNTMSFYRLHPPRLSNDQNYCFSDLSPGKYGILEPLKKLRNQPCNIVAPSSIEIMLTPGLAFDIQGRRLGRGAGYYDRYLAITSPNMLVVALAFDCQIVDEVPSEQFDVSVDAIITPTQILPISKKFKTNKFII